MSFLTLQGGQTDVELHRQYSGEEYTYTTRNLCNDGVAAQAATYPVGEAAHYTGHGIDVLTEDKGDFVDEDIAKHTTRSTGKSTHDGSYPEGEACIEGLLYTYNSKEGETNGVEDKEGVVHSY